MTKSLFVRTRTLLSICCCGLFLSSLLACGQHPGSFARPTQPQEPVGMAKGSPSTLPPGGTLVPAFSGPPPDPSLEELIYRIGPYDDLRVDVFGVPELSTEGRVNLQGLLDLPLIGPVMVNGMTPNEAETEIARRLSGRYLRDPKVTVMVKNSASLTVVVSGAVGDQGVHPIRGRTTLAGILAQAGGVSMLGKKRQVVLYRARKGPPGPQAEEDRTAYVIDYQAILDGKMRDPLVVGNDQIYVPESALSIFFGAGAQVVKRWLIPYGRMGL